MSGFTRDTKRYGDKLVYEALGSKWRRYHDGHCGCGLNWLPAPSPAAPVLPQPASWIITSWRAENSSKIRKPQPLPDGYLELHATWP